MSFFRAFLITALVLTAAAPASAFLDMFAKHEEVRAENGRVTIPVDRVSDGKAHYFRFQDGGAELRFFVLKSSDGVIRAAFDACDVCFREKKGYSQDKDFMVCNNCGMKFHSSRVNEVSGGCNPSPLKRTVEGDAVVVAVSDLVAGKGYF